MTRVKDPKPIFVAGATGYIGARLVPRLLDAGYHVRALARAPEKLRNRPWAQHPSLEIVKGDVLDKDSLAKATRHALTIYLVCRLVI